VALERLFAFPRGGIPHPHRLVARSGREAAAVGREGHGADPVAVALERLFAFPRGGIPHPHRLVARSGREAAAVGREGHGGDRAAVALEHLLAGIPVVSNAFNTRYTR
jgi:hypothetical protein